ncbi:YgcG family protein [Halomonas sp. I5-271120]|uniref:TPM domain-containing protein n=1 Tax=Halomonas sp. I5-271120 TaxID=3061632 RepID=UPI0027152A69|nr:TPM domain-containing protein [Halomonas sp. I5-271120]
MRLFRQLPVVLLLLVALGAQAQQSEFPELTGRVVDQADMLDAADETRLTEMLAAHEQATTEQVVVATLPNLQGRTIEEYGYQLGRHWGIGQKGEDNGALLIVARDERKLRIEVGYGLEGRLTDAQSSLIINQVITPAFQQGDFARGILEGTQAMIQVLGGDPLATSAPTAEQGKQGPDGPKSVLFFLLLLAVTGFLRGGRGGRGLLGGLLLGAALGGRGGHGGGGGLGGGGGFSGGGGGFGGGGASGGW